MEFIFGALGSPGSFRPSLMESPTSLWFQSSHLCFPEIHALRQSTVLMESWSKESRSEGSAQAPP